MTLAGGAPLVERGESLEAALRRMLGSRCRCAVVEEDGRPIGILSMMQLVRRLALEWLLSGTPPHESLRRLHVADIRLHAPIVFDEKPEPIRALIEMLTHGLNFVIVGRYTVYTVLDALMDSLQYLRGEIVSDVVATQKWWSALPSTSVRDAFLQVSMLPTWRLVLVDRYGGVQGIFSATDFLRAVLSGDVSYDEPASKIATRTPRTVDVEESLATTVRIMAEYDIHIMPVVRGVEGFIGVVHAYDIARLVAINILMRGRGGMGG